MIDSEPIGGPLALFRDGNLFNPTTGETQTIAHGLQTPVSLSGVSRDGSQLVLSSAAEQLHYPPHALVIPSTGFVQQVWDPEASLTNRARINIHPRQYRVQLKEVSGHQSGLWLRTKRERQLKLELDPTADRLCLKPGPGFILGLRRRAFSNLQSRKTGGHELQSAEWEDGSRVVLDSRGLLHLQSSDPDVPDATLVLYDDDVAGWCADGRMWGSEYYLGSDQKRSSPGSIWKTVITPFLQRLK